MALTNTEKQRAFKERMYAAGYKQVQIWVPRKNEPARPDRNRFIRELDSLTAYLPKREVIKLYKDLLAIIKARKEDKGK